MKLQLSTSTLMILSLLVKKCSTCPAEVVQFIFVAGTFKTFASGS